MSSYSDLSRIFTTSFIRQTLTDNHKRFIDELGREFAFVRQAIQTQDYITLFEQGYKELLKNYRCEYVYKSELYGKLKKESKKRNRDGILTEVRSGKSVADLLWLNGTSIAFEIKTEVDTDRRLIQQLHSYSQLFKQTVVVVHENNLEIMTRELPDYVGVMFMDKRGIVRDFKEPVEFTENLNPELMFQTLRRHEYESAITEAFGTLPLVSDAAIYTECLKLFRTLPPIKAHDVMVKQLKARGEIHLKSEFKWPKSLAFLLERGGLKRSEILKFNRRLQ